MRTQVGWAGNVSRFVQGVFWADKESFQPHFNMKSPTDAAVLRVRCDSKITEFASYAPPLWRRYRKEISQLFIHMLPCDWSKSFQKKRHSAVEKGGPGTRCPPSPCADGASDLLYETLSYDKSCAKHEKFVRLRQVIAIGAPSFC